MANNNLNKITLAVFIVFSFVFIFPLNNSLYANSFTSGSATNEQCSSNLGTPNIKDSLILSTISLCLPGLLEKAHEYREIKCEKVVCRYNAIINGLDDSFCSKQEAYKQCTYITGEIFVLPGLNIIDTLRDTISEIIANPAGYVLSWAANYAREYLKECGDCNSFGAIGFSFFLLAIDIPAFKEQLDRIKENGFSPTSTNYCEQMEDIESEVEEILQFQN